MATALLLQRKSDRPAGAHDPDEREVTGDGAGRVLVCAACLQAVTTTDSRVEVGGAHTHTFANPVGIVFHIGCFAVAPGCIPVGEASKEFTWFAGFAWQVATCRGCGEHLGWLFRSTDRRFHGLIVDRLAEVGEPDPGG
jgi:hypothetical protein